MMSENIFVKWWKMLFASFDDEEMDEKTPPQTVKKRKEQPVEEEPEILISSPGRRKKRQQEMQQDHIRKYKRPSGPTPIQRKQTSGARMTYQYPEKIPFRFPIISDTEPIGEEIVEQVRREESVQRPVENMTPPFEQPTKERPKPIKKYSNGPFKPQDVPSPIYGFQKQKEEPEILLHAVTETIPEGNTEQEEREFGVQQEEKQVGTEIKEATSLVVDESSDMLETESWQQNEEQQEEVGATEERAEEEKEIHVEEPDDLGWHKEETKNEETLIHSTKQTTMVETTQEEVAVQHAPVKKVSSASTTLPINVLMLEKDRKKLAQKKSHDFPSITLLDIPKRVEEDDETWLQEQKQLLNETFVHFNVQAHVVAITKGPTVTRFEVQPEKGVKVSKITNLTDDLKLSLAAEDIRIEAPIPGKSTVGIEVPNKKRMPVLLREVVRSHAFTKHPSPLAIALGKDIEGEPIVTDIKKMPHGLIAGATGSGKSVCINAMLVSLLYKATPQDVRLLLIDPKMVELAPYHHLPHLACPVITDVKEATLALKWAVDEMEARYQKFATLMVRDIEKYNQKIPADKLPYIVVVIDELADLMMVAPHDVEDSICRIAQKARACGIHLIVATQRPSVDVITGLIKANIPTRIAFSVSSQVDSRTIIDFSGAEKLLGSGDMLFIANGSGKPVRLQGNYVSDEEIERITDDIRKSGSISYLFEKEELLKKEDIDYGEDELFTEACEFVLQQGSASSSSLQRRFHIGFNRAARLIDMMEARGLVSGQNGSKPRDVLMAYDEFFIDEE